MLMVKSAQPEESGGGSARPPSFTLSTITSKVVVYAPAERADALALFRLYPLLFSVVSCITIWRCTYLKDVEEKRRIKEKCK
jgi:hypothetical protein